jgi:hypothetical protein
MDAMAEADIEFQHFEHLAAYSIAICKECRHGVLSQGANCTQIWVQFSC